MAAACGQPAAVAYGRSAATGVTHRENPAAGMARTTYGPGP
ncbi:hypothetical protein [Actinoplanes sp. NPDC089786]